MLEALIHPDWRYLFSRSRHILHLMWPFVDCYHSAFCDGAVCFRELVLIYTQTLFDGASARSLG